MSRKNYEMCELLILYVLKKILHQILLSKASKVSVPCKLKRDFSPTSKLNAQKEYKRFEKMDISKKG